MVSKNSFSALSSLRGLSVAPGSVFLGPWAGIDHEKFLIVAGTVIPVHRHPGTSEDVAILRGKAEEVFYDSEGHEVSRCLLSPGGDVPAVHVPMGQFHTCLSLETGTVIIEVKNTKYTPQGTELFGNEFE